MTYGTRDGCHASLSLLVDADMSATRVLHQWSVWMRAGGSAEGTIDLRCWHVSKVLRDMRKAPAEVTVADLVAYFGRQTWRPTTRRSYRASLRSFYAWMQDAGLVEVNPAGLLPRVRIPRALPNPVPEEIYREALRDAPSRDVRWMLTLAGACGLRRAEISRVRREDIVPDLLGHHLRVVGKGGHERVVPLPHDLAPELLAAPPGWIFPSPVRAAALTPGHVGVLVSRALPDGWSCHKLRHRCGTIGLWTTKDVRAVQELLGHASLDTTQIYTKVGPGALRAVVDATAA